MYIIFEDELRNMFFYPKVCMCKKIFQIEKKNILEFMYIFERMHIFKPCTQRVQSHLQ